MNKLAIALVLFAGSALAQTSNDFAALNFSGHPNASGSGGASGAASYRYDFRLPPARGRFQPSLALTYSSDGGNSPFGMGWSLTSSFIESSARVSPDPSNGSTRTEYSLTFFGSRMLLVPFPAGQTTTYRPDVNSGYAVVTWTTQVSQGDPGGPTFSEDWILVDGTGTSYTFTRLNFNGTAAFGPQFSRWYLTKVTDVDGNSAVYEYQPESTAVGVAGLLTRISYNNYGTPSTSYAHVVDLAYEPNPNPQVEAITGILVEHQSRLRAVTVSLRNASTGSLSSLCTYVVLYAQSPATGRQLIQQIVEYGRDGVTPATNGATFLYANQSNASTLGAALPLPPLQGPASLITPTLAECGQWMRTCRRAQPQCHASDVASWLDVDGDGRPDLVWGGPSTTNPGLRWARNIGHGGTPAFAPVEILPGSTAFNGIVSFSRPSGEKMSSKPFTNPDVFETLSRLMDFDGDGKPDLISSSGVCAGQALEVRFNRPDPTRNGAPYFAPPVCVDAAGPASDISTNYSAISVDRPIVVAGTDSGVRGIELQDVTGDGIADYIIVSTSASSPGWHVYPGYGSDATGWHFAGTPIIFHPAGTNPVSISLTDLNGDGLPDLISGSVTTPSASDVQFNSGIVSGWAGRPDGSSAPWALGDGSDGTIQSLAEMNRDGRPDSIVAGTITCPGRIAIYANLGLSFGAAPACGATAWLRSERSIDDDGTGTGTCDGMSGSNSSYVDADGDGVIDFVSADTAWNSFPTNFANTPPADTLTQVVTASGASIQYSYGPSSAYLDPNRFERTGAGGIRYVLTQMTTTGPGLRPLTISYYYANPAVIPSWDEPTRLEPLGFLDTYSRDNVTLLVRHTQWGATHATVGFPIREDAGTSGVAFGSDLATTLASVSWFRTTTHSPLARAVATAGSCSSDPAAYPVVVFDSLVDRQTVEGGTTLHSTTAIACNDVDAAGNVLAVTTDADTAASGDEFTEYRSFPDPASSAAACKSCVLEVSAKTTSTGDDLSHRFYHYDAPAGSYDPAGGPQRSIVTNGHLNYVEELVSGTGLSGTYEVASKQAYNADGTLASTRKDYPAGQRVTSVTTTLAYDSQHLRAVTSTVADQVSSGIPSAPLVTSKVYDPVTGLLSQVTGPYLSGATNPGPTQKYQYDILNRVIAVGRVDISAPSGVQTLAFEYGTPTSTSVGFQRSYTFLSSYPFPSAVPNKDDVIQKTAYYDALGRTIQTRVRTGTGVSGASTTGIVQHLATQYLVSAALYDGAGRLVESLDPYYASGIAFQDLWTSTAELNTAGLHGTSLGYDAKGRTVCSVYWPVAGAIQAAPSSCVSDFTASVTAYRRATATVYGRAASPDGTARSLLTVDTRPDWENVAGATFTPPRQYLDAAGRLLFASDAGGNLEAMTRDVLGREVGHVRYAGGTSSPSRVSVTTSYDKRGRVASVTDDSFGTRLYTYLPTGEVIESAQHPTASVPEGDLGVQYLYGSLGRLEKKWTFSWTQSGGLWQRTPSSASMVGVDASTFTYDLPYPPGGYAYTAGRLASESNPNMTIAYGYDSSGRVVQRDVSLNGLSGTHSVSTVFTVDGRMGNRVVSSPTLASSLQYFVGYDSLGRPVEVDPGYWYVATTGQTTPAYDALGRLAREQMDSGAAATTRQFDPISNLPTALTSLVSNISTGVTSNLYNATTLTYSGTRLRDLDESVSGNHFHYDYDPDGRLSLAQAISTATPAPPLQQVYADHFGFTMAGGGSLWNLTSVAGSTDTATYNYSSPSSEGLVSITHTSGATDLYSTDIYGRVTSHTVGSQMMQKFTYDAEDHVTQIFGAGNMTTPEESLDYGPAGALVSRRFPNGDRTWYLGSDLTIKKVGTTTQGTVHVSPCGTRVVSITGTTKVFYYRDRLGSVVATSLAGGVQGAGYRYGPYGAMLKSGETSVNTSELGYTGALQLSEGLVYLNARVYNPQTRRFLQADTVDTIRYTYVRGDPIDFTDSTGHQRDVHTDAPRMGGGGADWSLMSSLGDYAQASFEINAASDAAYNAYMAGEHAAAQAMVAQWDAWVAQSNLDLVDPKIAFERDALASLRETASPRGTPADALTLVLTVTGGPSTMLGFIGADASTGFAVGMSWNKGFTFEWISQANGRAGVGGSAGVGVMVDVYPTAPTAADIMGDQTGFGADAGIWSVQKMQSGPYTGGAIGVSIGGGAGLYWFGGTTYRTGDIGGGQPFILNRPSVVGPFDNQ